LEELCPKITKQLTKIGMNIYNKEEREEDFYKGSFPLVDDKLQAEVLVPCYDDEQVFAERKEKFPKMQKFDEDNDLITDEEQLQMEIKRGKESLTKFIEEEKKDKNYLHNKLSRNDIPEVEESKKKKEKGDKENDNKEEESEEEDEDFNMDNEVIEQSDFEYNEEEDEEDDDKDEDKIIIDE